MSPHLCTCDLGDKNSPHGDTGSGQGLVQLWVLRMPAGRQLHNAVKERMEQITQRGGRCPIPQNIPGQAGRGSEQPDPGEDVPAHCRGVGLDGHQRSLPTQSIL